MYSRPYAGREGVEVEEVQSSIYSLLWYQIGVSGQLYSTAALTPFPGESDTCAH